MTFALLDGNLTESEKSGLVSGFSFAGGVWIDKTAGLLEGALKISMTVTETIATPDIFCHIAS